MVAHLARLARIELKQEEIAEIQHELSRLVDYVSLIDPSPTLAAREGNHALGRRLDEPRTSFPEPILSQSKGRDGAFVRVPKVVDSDG